MFTKFVTYDKTSLRSQSTGMCEPENVESQDGGDGNIGVIAVLEIPYEVDDWIIDPVALEAVEEFPCDFYSVASQRVKPQEEIDAIAYADRSLLCPGVDTERDRRLEVGFMFQGNVYQARPKDLTNFTALGADARFAMMAGAQAGNYRWADPSQDFGWITADNTIVPMDAPTMVELSTAAKLFVTSHTFTCRAIKDQILAGMELDITDNSLWP